MSRGGATRGSSGAEDRKKNKASSDSSRGRTSSITTVHPNLYEFPPLKKRRKDEQKRGEVLSSARCPPAASTTSTISSSRKNYRHQDPPVDNDSSITKIAWGGKEEEESNTVGRLVSQFNSDSAAKVMRVKDSSFSISNSHQQGFLSSNITDEDATNRSRTTSSSGPTLTSLDQPLFHNNIDNNFLDVVEQGRNHRTRNEISSLLPSRAQSLPINDKKRSSGGEKAESVRKDEDISMGSSGVQQQEGYASQKKIPAANSTANEATHDFVPHNLTTTQTSQQSSVVVPHQNLMGQQGLVHDGAQQQQSQILQQLLLQQLIHHHQQQMQLLQQLLQNQRNTTIQQCDPCTMLTNSAAQYFQVLQIYHEQVQNRFQAQQLQPIMQNYILHQMRTGLTAIQNSTPDAPLQSERTLPVNEQETSELSRQRQALLPSSHQTTNPNSRTDDKTTSSSNQQQHQGNNDSSVIHDSSKKSDKE